MNTVYIVIEKSEVNDTTISEEVTLNELRQLLNDNDISYCEYTKDELIETFFCGSLYFDNNLYFTFNI